MSSPDALIPLSEIEAAASRIAKHIHRTPVLTCGGLDRRGAGNEDRHRRFFLKCENFQKVGAFKARGALNAVACALAENPGLRAVVTHSSGNHAQAIAYAAQVRGLEAHIVMPRTAPAVKKNAVRDTYRARVVECEPTLAAREAAAKEAVEKSGGVFIHPYNDPRVRVGQGTCALELMQQTAAMGEELDAVVIAV
eukprot:Hpha_TRINITY_DN17506_c0_g1::TRINITY_DN17506_c0_g1_i1::g.92539::m.92539